MEDNQQQKNGEQDTTQSIDDLQQEIERKRQEAKEQGLPFVESAYLRRLKQGQSKYFDSAEYVLKHGWPTEQKPGANASVNPVFAQNIHPQFGKTNTAPQSRLKSNTAAEDTDDE